MPRMTEEEADALDELVTRNPPRVSGDGKSGFFMKHKGNIEIITSDEEKKWKISHKDHKEGFFFVPL